MINYYHHFSDKELITDLYVFEKQVSSAYHSAITETCCRQLKQQLIQCLLETQEIQCELLELMKKRGWQQIKQASSQDIHDVKMKYNQMKKELF